MCTRSHIQRQVIDVSVGLSGVEAPESGKEKDPFPEARGPSHAGHQWSLCRWSDPDSSRPWGAVLRLMGT